jgi:hypothetical protein
VWQVGNVQSITELCFVLVTVQTELLRVWAVFVVHMMVYFGFLNLEARGRDSSVVIAIATGWMVRGSNPVGGEILRTRIVRPWGPPSLLYNGYRAFPGGKTRPGLGVDHPPHLAPRLKKEHG